MPLLSLNYDTQFVCDFNDNSSCNRFQVNGNAKTRIWLTCVNRQGSSRRSLFRFRSIMFQGCVDIDLSINYALLLLISRKPNLLYSYKTL